MNNNYLAKAILSLFAVTLISLFCFSATQQQKPFNERILTSYQTSSLRTNNVQTFCPSNVDRTNLVPQSEIFTASDLKNTVNEQLGIDGNTLINQLVRGDIDAFLSTIKAKLVNLVMYIGTFLLPFLVFIIAWPFLWCCCACPLSCPLSCITKSCQKPQEERYTRCQMLWPALTLLLAHALIISFGIYGFSTTSKVGPTIRNMGCSLAIFTDDLLNGNVTIPKTSYFTGLNLFAGNLGDLSGNLSNIKNNLTDLSDLTSGDTYTHVDNVDNAITTIKNIPDNLGLSAMNLVYSTPISASTPTGTISSSFNSILGSWTTPNSLVSNLYLSVQSARTIMNGIKISSNAFAGQVNNIQTSITPMNTSLHALINDVINLDNKLTQILNIFDTPARYANLAMQCFYGILIGFSALGVLGLIFMACFHKAGCRHLIYVSCVVLFLIGWAAFTIAVVFSFLVPIFTWTCSFLEVAQASLSGFQYNFGSLLSNTTSHQISVCMPFGDGVIVNTIGGNAKEGLNNLTTVITSLGSFNNTLLKTNIAVSLEALVSTTNAYANGDISDLDSTNNNILLGFSDPNNSTNNALCNSSFASDSWVPSNNQNTLQSSAIICKSNSGYVGSYSTCDVNLGPSLTCKGCMDTTQVLVRESNAGAVLTAVQGKYGASCAFATILSNAWTNYFSKKYTTLGYPTVATQSAGTVMYRMKQTQDIINITANAASVFASIDSFKGSLTTISGNMNSISTLTDPNYGMLAGLNCKLFGQDFIIFQNIICVSAYNNMYNIRIIFGICAWGILFVTCCSVCTGVRHYNQLSQGAKVTPMQETSVHNIEDQGSKHPFKQSQNFD